MLLPENRRFNIGAFGDLTPEVSKVVFYTLAGYTAKETAIILEKSIKTVKGQQEKAYKEILAAGPHSRQSLFLHLYRTFADFPVVDLKREFNKRSVPSFNFAQLEENQQKIVSQVAEGNSRETITSKLGISTKRLGRELSKIFVQSKIQSTYDVFLVCFFQDIDLCDQSLPAVVEEPQETPSRIDLSSVRKEAITKCTLPSMYDESLQNVVGWTVAIENIGSINREFTVISDRSSSPDQILSATVKIAGLIRGMREGSPSRFINKLPDDLKNEIETYLGVVESAIYSRCLLLEEESISR